MPDPETPAPAEAPAAPAPAPEPAPDVAYGVTLADYTVGDRLSGQIVFGPAKALAASIKANAVRAATADEIARAGHFLFPLPPA